MPPENFGEYPVIFYPRVLRYCEAVIFSLLPELRVAGILVEEFFECAVEEAQGRLERLRAPHSHGYRFLSSTSVFCAPR